MEIRELNDSLVERTQQLNPVLFFSAELSDTESELGAIRARAQRSASPIAPKKIKTPITDFAAPTHASRVSVPRLELDDDATPEPSESGRTEEEEHEDTEESDSATVGSGYDVNSSSPSPRLPLPISRVKHRIPEQLAHVPQGLEPEEGAYLSWTDPGHNLETLSEASETSTSGLMEALDEACSSSHEFPSNISLLSQTTPVSSIDRLPATSQEAEKMMQGRRRLKRSLSDPHLSRPATADLSDDDVTVDDDDVDEELALKLEDLADSHNEEDDVKSVGALAASFDTRLTPRAISVGTPRSETQVRTVQVMCLCLLVSVFPH